MSCQRRSQNYTNTARRTFLTRIALLAATPSAALQELLARVARNEPTRPTATRVGYGPLMPVPDATTGLPLLLLPKGFRYTTFGYIGDSLDGGGTTPALHDGMGAFALPGVIGGVSLVRNHEILDGPHLSATGPAYDSGAGGGTTTVDFDTRRGVVIRQWTSLGGTLRNCAGGRTPWGSWLTCEETVADPGPGSILTKPHGYVFEVPVRGRADAEPLRALGRFVHEAVVVDPCTGFVYETEDQRRSGFYRFTPRTRAHLADGGTLEMLSVRGRPQLETSKGQAHNVAYEVEWVHIERPDCVHDNPMRRDNDGVFMQGHRQGGAVFARCEGAFAAGEKIYFVVTNGGDAGQGQVWEYDPLASVLRLVFESPGEHVLGMPDNVCMSPRGGLVLCEDGSGTQFVRGLTASGEIFPFAQNNVVLHGRPNGLVGDYRRSELAGVCYSPDGDWLFFNVQVPGFTVAVSGPWGRGAL